MSKLSRPKIALFGGSFDPIHQGHLLLLETVLAECQIDQILLIPCKQSPHKNHAPRATDAQRLEMCRLATAHLDHVSVLDLEITRPAPSYSWMTVEQMQRNYPEAELHWIMGTDQWNVLDRWYRADFLMAQLHFIVVQRQSPVCPKPNVKHTALPFDSPISSTQIRDALSKSEPAPGLTESVQQYIDHHQLYL